MLSEESKTVPRRLPARRDGRGAWACEFFSQCSQAATDFWNSRYYFPSLLLAAAVFMLQGQSLLGIELFGCIFAVFLLLCRDTLAACLPLFLLFLLGADYYDRIGILFSQCRWLLPLVLVAMAAHLVFNARPWRRGKLTSSLLAVSAATLLGGLGAISKAEYWSPTALYYAFGLGPVMLLLYGALRAQLSQSRPYNLLERFAGILYATGVFAGVVVLQVYLERLPEFFRTFSSLDFPYRNYCATILLTALPMPCYFMKKNGRHLLGLAALYVALLMTGSRSGLVFGTGLLIVCLIYAYKRNPRFRRHNRAILLGLLPVAAVLVLFARDLFSSRMTGGTLISPNDSRITFFLQGIRDFQAHPLFGIGLGSMENSEIFLGVPGSIVWYHNALAQVLGSMGLLGLMAYLWQLVSRLYLLRKTAHTEAAVFGLAYGGMFLMSMTNPGEFCPFPNAFLVMLLFAVVEQVQEEMPPDTV